MKKRIDAGTRDRVSVALSTAISCVETVISDGETAVPAMVALDDVLSELKRASDAARDGNMQAALHYAEGARSVVRWLRRHKAEGE